MNAFKHTLKTCLPVLVVLGVIVMKIGPARIAHNFDNWWNAAEIREREQAEMWESAQEAHESMLRSVTEARFGLRSK